MAHSRPRVWFNSDAASIISPNELLSLKQLAAAREFWTRAVETVINTNCSCEGHSCHSSMLVEPSVGGRAVNWPDFLKEYDRASFKVVFTKMHNDHFTAEFSDATTKCMLLRICVLQAQKAQIESWIHPASAIIQ